jgi:hypothetical protein
MRCHWHRVHDFCVRKSIISRQIRSRIKKGFSLWIRGPGGIVWWKKPEGQNSRTTVPLSRFWSFNETAEADSEVSMRQDRGRGFRGFNETAEAFSRTIIDSQFL